MKLVRKIQTGFLVALGFLILTGLAAIWSAALNLKAFQRVDRTYHVLEKLEAVLVQALEAETAMRGFAVSGDERFLDPYRRGAVSAPKILSEIKALTHGHQSHQSQLSRLESLIERKLEVAESIVNMRLRGEVESALKLVSSGHGLELMSEIRKLIAEMEGEESSFLNTATAKARNGSVLTIAIVAFANVFAFMLVGGASVVVRRDVEKRLRAEEERDRFFTLSLDMLCIANSDGFFKRLSPAFTQTLGWTVEELLARPFIEFVHPEDRKATIVEFERQVKSGEKTLHFANRYLHKDGSWRWLSWKSAPQPGGVMFATARDVTELREAENALRRSEEAIRESEGRLRTLNEELERRVEERTAEVREALATLDATKDAAFIFDPATLRLRYVNEGALHQTGHTRAELLNVTILEIASAFTEPAFRAMLEPLLLENAPPLQFITQHRHKDGRQIPVEVTLQYISRAGERPRFISIARDITDRQKHERLALRSQRLEAIGTLAGGVAHDLNNALAPIMMGVEMIKMQYPEKSEIIDLFQTSARRGSDMVRQLLSFAKGAEGERICLQPARLVKEMENMIKGSFPKNIRLVVKCEPKLPTILGDATQVHQVLLNLCVNARDAMPNGGTLSLESQRIEVDAAYASSTPDASPGNYIVLRVRDTGTGIPPEILERIFDPFFTTKGPDKGTGLGLSTVMGIVKGHGGFLQVYSQVGQGSTFSAYFPVDAAGIGNDHRPNTSTDFRGQDELILFVDDEAPLRDIARAVLRRLNFRSVTATDGVDGLIQAAQHRTELRAVITDLHMPHMDGLNFVRGLRRILPEISVIVISGRMEESVAAELETLGVKTRLDKPFTEVQLAEALKTTFGTTTAS